MKIVILGSTGMLGHMVFNYFKSQEGYEVVGSVRDDLFLDHDTFIFDPLLPLTWDNIPSDADYIINCVGKIKPQMMKNLADSIYINAIFPHRLADKCALVGSKMIHITTDCVFSGADGGYDEASLHDAYDEYGKSKSLGEPKNCMVIRTSIIGTEIHNNSSLISWVQGQGGKIINGYTNHYWNGITTLQFAKVCDQIIRENLYVVGLFHVYSPDLINKYGLVNMIDAIYEVGIGKINSTTASESIDRTLTSAKPLCGLLNIPSLKIQLQDMKLFGK
jgi:dTDP-4-dehydrorhamnose reductase